MGDLGGGCGGFIGMRIGRIKPGIWSLFPSLSKSNCVVLKAAGRVATHALSWSRCRTPSDSFSVSAFVLFLSVLLCGYVSDWAQRSLSDWLLFSPLSWLPVCVDVFLVTVKGFWPRCCFAVSSLRLHSGFDVWPPDLLRLCQLILEFVGFFFF